MQTYVVECGQAFEITVQANSPEDVLEAMNALTSREVADLDPFPEWEFSVHESGCDPDNGVWNGELVAIEDMPTAEEIEAELTEDERYRRDYAVDDPRQMKMEVA